MTKTIKYLINGAGRIMDISGTATTIAYGNILTRRDTRTDREKLRSDMDKVGNDLVKVLNCKAMEIAHVQD